CFPGPQFNSIVLESLPFHLRQTPRTRQGTAPGTCPDPSPRSPVLLSTPREGPSMLRFLSMPNNIGIPLLSYPEQCSCQEIALIHTKQEPNTQRWRTERIKVG